ncbi:MAG TPA: GDSL-type esterase/lipase family protein [Terracidiphilus sp.]|nr:GDSL-type esterase/lipase family protein [Terracidiphilus sp.]
MSKVRYLGVLLCVSLLANLLFLASGALYVFYVRKHGGVARFVERFGAPAPITLNGTIDSVVRRSLFETLETSSVDSPTVFLGDSLTELCEWNELLDLQVLNRGISSDTTVDVLDRLDAVLALHPKAIYLMIGINDAVEGSSVADTAGRYQQILQTIHKASPTTRVYMQSVLPVLSTGSLVEALGGTGGPRLNQWVRQMNQTISGYADNKSIFYINVHDDLLENEELAPRFTVDGIHLSGAGYIVWKQRVLPFLTRP